MAAATALPAFAAPTEWGFESTEAASAPDRPATMPFERPGASFPGAAFYYLAAEAAAPTLDAGAHSDADPAPSSVAAIGPAARAMRVDNSGVDRVRALQCLAAAIYYEAASEPDAGQRAVAQVVLNRVAHPSYPNTVCGVVYQGSQRSTGCQFSFTCDGALARVPNRMFWLRAENVARQALAGSVYAPAGLATHYHTVAVHPYWASSLNYLGTIGAHRFYRFRGPAGQPATFRFAYLGGEPSRSSSDTPQTAAQVPSDPLTIQRAYEGGLQSARRDVVLPAATGTTADGATPLPAYSPELQRRGGDALYRADNLPGSAAVLPEYQHSGRWIAQPGT